MDPLKTNALPRGDIADFIKSDRGVRSYEDLQGDAVNVYEAINTGSFLTITGSPSLGSERTLTLTADLTGSDGGPNALYTLGLSDTTVVPGTYGSASKVASFTVSAKGRLTAAAEYALNSDNVTEGATNLYFTNARARAALSGGTGISYNSGTGAIAVSAKLALYDGGDTPSAFTLGIVDSVDAGAWRTAIGAGTSSTTGTVTSIDVSGGTTGLTTSGGPITTFGTITLSGTLVAANGGTGQSSYAVGDILYASTSAALSKLADVASGNALISGGVGVAPSWDKIGLTTHVTGTLPVANGGTGVTASTGTTAVVLSTKPQFANTIGVGVAASASGSGISFPATQSDSTDPNTLDDYEEGTWTPVVTAISGTITTMGTVTGSYTKVGRMVVASVRAPITTNGTGATGLVVTMPFTNNSGMSHFGSGRENGLTGSTLQIELSSGSGSATVFTYNNGYPGGSGAVATFTLTYFV